MAGIAMAERNAAVKKVTSTLEELLENLGIEPIPIELVRQYQKDRITLARKDAGLLGKSRLLALIVLFTPFLPVVGLPIFALIFGGIYLSFWKGLLIGLIAVLVSLKATRDFLNSWIGDQLLTDIANGLAFWQRVRYRQSSLLPYRIARNINSIQKLPGVKIVIEEFRDDPFVFVERGRWPNKERCCIGYWDACGFDEMLLEYEFAQESK